MECLKWMGLTGMGGNHLEAVFAISKEKNAGVIWCHFRKCHSALIGHSKDSIQTGNSLIKPKGKGRNIYVNIWEFSPLKAEILVHLVSMVSTIKAGREQEVSKISWINETS